MPISQGRRRPFHTGVKLCIDTITGNAPRASHRRDLLRDGGMIGRMESFDPPRDLRLIDAVHCRE